MPYSNEHSIWIDRTPADVFNFSTHHGNWGQLIPGVVTAHANCEVATQGETFSLTIASMGQNFEIEGEWTRVEPGVSYESKVTTGPVASSQLTSFVAENGGTRVERVLKMDTRGFFRLADPLMKRRSQRDLETEFANLKDLLEADA